MERDPRKVTSDKYTMTLPKEWREILNIQPGDLLKPHFVDGSPLILIPMNRPLSDLESVLTELLIYGPTPEKTRNLIDRLERAKHFLESAAVAVA
uniref:Putative antitoxin family protein n=2 Tax=viral metagenome TaxID=1070528 RepID=A0A6M3M5U7_9ZZZZ